MLPDGSDHLTFTAKDEAIGTVQGGASSAPSAGDKGDGEHQLASIATDDTVLDACQEFSSEQIAALLQAGAAKQGSERKDIVSAMRAWAEQNNIAVTRELRICMSAISKAIVAVGDSALALPDDLPAAAARGAEVYAAGHCGKCHESNGRGSEKGPDLTDGDWLHCDGSVAGIHKVLLAGVPANRLKDRDRPFAMNPATELISDKQQIIELAIYVESLSQR